jgi:hypothetical protein
MGKASAFAYLFVAAPLVLAGCNQPPADTASTEAPTEVATNATEAGHGMMPANATDEQIVASAEAAAPAAIAKAATIIAANADGTMREVRKGSIGWTCMADNPATPGPDPMCGDANAMQWIQAWLGKKEPDQSKIGFMYMLAGGTDASNTDPHATAPTADNNWIKTGPHVMIVGGKGTLAGYPRSAQPDTSSPYVMFPDTPYEHLMLPVG